VPGIRLHHFGLNLAGGVLPLAAALFSVPVIENLAGIERLGWLMLIWTLVGYLGLLDLGLGRVLIRRFAQCADAAEVGAAMALLWRICRIAGATTIAIAALLAALLWAFSLPGQSAQSALGAEAVAAAWIVLAVLPAVVVSSLLRGALEGRSLFGHSNALKVIFGSLTFAAPMAAAYLSPTLPSMALAVAVTRLAGGVAHAWVVMRALPRPTAAGRTQRIGPLLAEGGWMTVTNVVGPLLVTFDRFAVAALVSAAAVAHYAVIQEIALRLLVVPLALSATVFPALSERSATAAASIGRGSVHAVLLISLPLCAAFAAFAQPAVALWLGAEFAEAIGPIAAILACGLLANCVAQVPFTWVQARGRADLTGRLHLAEALPYAAVLLVAVTSFGVIGVAIAWSLRMIADCALLFALAARLGLFRVRQIAGDLAGGLAIVALIGAGNLASSSAVRDALMAAGLLLAALQMRRLLRLARGSAAATAQAE